MLCFLTRVSRPRFLNCGNFQLYGSQFPEFHSQHTHCWEFGGWSLLTFYLPRLGNSDLGGILYYLNKPPAYHPIPEGKQSFLQYFRELTSRIRKNFCACAEHSQRPLLVLELSEKVVEGFVVLQNQLEGMLLTNFRKMKSPFWSLTETYSGTELLNLSMSVFIIFAVCHFFPIFTICQFGLLFIFIISH